MTTADSLDLVKFRFVEFIKEVLVPENLIPIDGNSIILKGFLIGFAAIILDHRCGSAPDGIYQLLGIISRRSYLSGNPREIVLYKNILVHWQQSTIQIKKNGCN